MLWSKSIDNKPSKIQFKHLKTYKTMETHTIDHMLNHTEDINMQIKFAQMCSERFREQNDPRMASMYANIADNLKRLHKKKAV
jgi:hypothetical protein